LSLIASAIIFIVGTTQVGYGLAPRFSLATFNYSSYPALGLAPATKAFLASLQQKGGLPFYTLSPENARAVLNGLEAVYSNQKLPADIENGTIPDGPNRTKVSITIVRPPNSSNETLPYHIHTWRWMGSWSVLYSR
jgi:hypothetical protein